MSSIFPSSGVPAAQAQNSVDVATTNCDEGELFHSTARCQPRFDPAAANAVMSELLNFVGLNGQTWDCSRLDNLKLTGDTLAYATFNDDFDDRILNGCYEIADIGADCNVQQVGFVTDSGGTCGRLVTYTTYPFPDGIFNEAAGIVGSFDIQFTGNAADRSARLEAILTPIVGAPTEVYEIWGGAPLTRTLSTADYCGLNTAGVRIDLETIVNIGYFMDTNIQPLRAIGAYQYGVAVFQDGNLIAINGDGYAMNYSGFNSFLSDNQRATVTTTGADILMEIVPFIRADPASPNYNANDSALVDMGQATARYTRQQ